MIKASEKTTTAARAPRSSQPAEGSFFKKPGEDAFFGAPDRQTSFFAPAPSPKGATEEPKDSEIVSLTTSVFLPSEPLNKSIAGSHSGKFIQVAFGNYAKGSIKIRKQKEAFETVGGPQAIPLEIPFLRPLVDAGIQPLLAVKIKESAISGYMTLGVGKSLRVGSDEDIFQWIRGNSSLMKWKGMENLVARKANITNKIEGDKLHLEVRDIQARLGGFVDGTFSIRLHNSEAVVEGNAIVTVKNLANGTLQFKRDPLGDLRGQFEMQATKVRDLTGAVKGAFLNGNFDIHGVLHYSTEKLSGDINVIVTDPMQARGMVLQQLEPQQISKEAQDRAGIGAAVSGPQPGPRAIAGWGTLDFAFNQWLTGKARVIIDGEGYVTVHGEITPPAEVRLFVAKPYRSPNFIDLHPTFRWGLPHIADLHVGLDFLLYAEAQIGPAFLRNIRIIGNYSTDPSLYNDFRVQGTFNMMGYAGLVFTFGARAGTSILGFDIDLKGGLTATAGIRAYVEATPVIGYREKADPVAGKKGDFYISGQAEAAAQPFLALDGEVGVEVDSPWPIPNFSRSWPLFHKEYALPGQFGVSMTFGEYILGSQEWPTIDFNKVSFDQDKFTDDLIERNIPPKDGHPEEKKGGFADKLKGMEPAPAPPSRAMLRKPPAKGKEAKPPTREVLARWGKGMKSLKSLKDKLDDKPEAKSKLFADLERIKRLFGFTVLVADPSGNNWSIYAEMPGIDNANAPIGIKGLAEEKPAEHAEGTVPEGKAEVEKAGGKGTGAAAGHKRFMEVPLDEGTEHHHAYLDVDQASPVPMVASLPMTMRKHIEGLKEDKRFKKMHASIDAALTALKKYEDAVEASGLAKDAQKLKQTVAKDLKAAKGGPQTSDLAAKLDPARYANLLAAEKELVEELKDLFDGITLQKSEEKYQLEGHVAPYAESATMKGDSITPDHQPANLLYQIAANLKDENGKKLFTKGPIVERASNRSAHAWAINIHFRRHVAGRTFGNKASVTAENAQTKMEQIAKNAKLKDKAAKIVEVLQEERNEDAHAMIAVATDIQDQKAYSDLDELFKPRAKASAKEREAKETDRDSMKKEQSRKIIEGEARLLANGDLTELTS